MQKRSFRPLATVFFASLILFLMNIASSGEEAKTAAEPEPELVIVKYGSLMIKSSVPDAKVYIDDSFKGNVNDVLESIPAGEHLISCKSDVKSVSGTFQVRKNETLHLEARFDEGRLVPFKEAVKAEVEKKKPEPPVQEKPKRTMEPKKVEQKKNPVEERRRTHFNVMRLDYEVTDTPNVKIQQAANQSVISRLSLKKNATGKYYRTKQGALLCDVGPCELTWSASFMYTDETSHADAVLLNWKETIFNGITPTGTSRHDLECCLNGQCSKMQEESKIDTQEFEIGRYRLVWSSKSVVLRRSDIMKEILDAGRSLADY